MRIERRTQRLSCQLTVSPSVTAGRGTTGAGGFAGVGRGWGGGGEVDERVGVGSGVGGRRLTLGARRPKTTFISLVSFCSAYRLVGLVVKAPVSRAEDPGFESRLLPGIFSGSSHTSDFKIGTPVATLQGAWCYRVSTDWSARCQYTVTG